MSKPRRRPTEKKKPERYSAPKPSTAQQPFLKIWKSLFESPIHLDSALAKQPEHRKAAMAQVLSEILLRPVSTAQELGVGVSPGEPWSLKKEKLGDWKTADAIALRLKESLSSGGVHAEPMSEDFPDAMQAEWRKDWGDEVASDLTAVLGREAPLSLRSPRGVGAAELLKELKKDSTLPVRAQLSDLSPVGVRLDGFARVFGRTEIPFEIQDEGSQLMTWVALWPEVFGELLQDVPGSRKPSSPKAPKLPASPPPLTIVDACAGAGGKSLAFADALGGKGRVYAYDTSAKKLQALSRRATRSGLNNIQSVTVTEGAEHEVVKKFRKRADIVLVDAPCTGWGVLRRNPDIKWRQEESSLQRMPEIQKRLLDAYSDLVRPGGRLVFGVCTFRRAETRAIVNEFAETHPDFKMAQGGFIGPGPSDGFFVQVFERAGK